MLAANEVDGLEVGNSQQQQQRKQKSGGARAEVEGGVLEERGGRLFPVSLEAVVHVGEWTHVRDQRLGRFGADLHCDAQQSDGPPAPLGRNKSQITSHNPRFTIHKSQTRAYSVYVCG